MQSEQLQRVIVAVVLEARGELTVAHNWVTAPIYCQYLVYTGSSQMALSRF